MKTADARWMHINSWHSLTSSPYQVGNQSVFIFLSKRKITTKMKIFILIFAVLIAAADAEGNGVVDTGEYGNWHDALRHCENESLSLISISSDEDYEKKIASNRNFSTVLWVHDSRANSEGDRCTATNGWERETSILVQPCENSYLIVCETGHGGRTGKELFVPPGDARNYTEAEEACAEGKGSIISINSDKEYYDYLNSDNRLHTVIWVRHHSGGQEGACVTSNVGEEMPNFVEQPCENSYHVVCEKKKEDIEPSATLIQKLVTFIRRLASRYL